LSAAPDDQHQPGQNLTELWNQLGNAITLVSKEDQVVWTIFGIFWAANILLLGALFVTGRVPDPPVGAIISAGGVALCLVWTLVQSRALRFLSFYEAVQKALEARLIKEPQFALTTTINQAAFGNARGTDVRARRVMMTSSIVTTIFWLIGVILFVILLKGCRLTSA
jgi:hypothetical protein